MPGNLIALVAYGAQDTYNIQNPIQHLLNNSCTCRNCNTDKTIFSKTMNVTQSKINNDR